MARRDPLLILLLAALPASCTTLLGDLADLAERSTIVVAHRGDSGTFPENTMPAFDSAIAKSADLVELDFYQTKDGVLVCFHDRTLDRTTDAVSRWNRTKAMVRHHTLAELQELDAGRWKGWEFRETRIPTLEDALQRIQRDAVTMIEHKEGDAEVLVTLLRRLGMVERVLVQSFDWDFLAEMHRLEPKILLAALGPVGKAPHPDGEVLDRLRRTHAKMVHWSFRRLRQYDVHALHVDGYLVCVYTVNREEDLRRALDMGVDAITTDHPARLRRMLRGRGMPRLNDGAR